IVAALGDIYEKMSENLGAKLSATKVTTTVSTSGPVTSTTTASTSGPVTSTATTSTSGPVISTTTVSTSGPVTSTTTSSSSGQCSDDFCVADRTTFPNLLPAGQITTESFSFTDYGAWYLAGYSSDDGIRMLWRLHCNQWLPVAEKTISNIEVSGNDIFVFGISEGDVGVFYPKNNNAYRIIAQADPSKEYTGVTFDQHSNILYVTEKATGQIARFTGHYYGFN
ncbi:conserved hypothetical protein, partial [Perkinsus marinus ATCC 50983]